jgi:RTX calcium-binding nonapeptide repeat (4 copies)
MAVGYTLAGGDHQGVDLDLSSGTNHDLNHALQQLDGYHSGDADHVLADGTGDDNSDRFFGGSGAATMFGGGGHDTFFGGSGGTTMVGGTGFSFFQGGAGSSSMVGGSNWNYFTGGSGYDTMVAHTVAGQADQNVFTFDAHVGGNHEIDGYSAGGDSSLHLNFTNYGLTADQIATHASVVGTDTVITLDAAGGNPATTITLKGYTGSMGGDITSHNPTGHGIFG